MPTVLVYLARTIELQSVTPSYSKKHLEGQPRVRGRTQNTDRPHKVVGIRLSLYVVAFSRVDSDLLAPLWYVVPLVWTWFGEDTFCCG